MSSLPRFENMSAAKTPEWATIKINELDESIQAGRELMEKRVPEPVLVGPPTLVDAAVRSLAEQGIHGVRTIKSEFLDKLRVLPDSVFAVPASAAVDIQWPVSKDGPPFKWTVRRLSQPITEREIAAMIAAIRHDAEVLCAAVRIRNVYLGTHRNPWRKCRRNLKAILDPEWLIRGKIARALLGSLSSEWRRCR